MGGCSGFLLLCYLPRLRPAPSFPPLIRRRYFGVGLMADVTGKRHYMGDCGRVDVHTRERPEWSGSTTTQLLRPAHIIFPLANRSQSTPHMWTLGCKDFVHAVFQETGQKG